MAALENGSFAFVSYDGEGLWHERLVVAWVEGGEYVVVTPDFDIFIELLDSTNTDLDGLRFADAATGLPTGLAGQALYRFRDRVAGAELQALFREGALLAGAERLARGLVGSGGRVPGNLGGALPPVVQPEEVLEPVGDGERPPRVAGPAGAWVVDEPASGISVGRTFALPADALRAGHRAFVRVGETIVSATFLEADTDIDAWTRDRVNGFLKADGRVLPKVADPAGRTLESLYKEVAHSREPLPPLRGPGTIVDTFSSILEKGPGGFTAAHERWVVESCIERTHRSVYEHRVLCRALQLGVQQDRFDIGRSAAFEYLNRRRQLIEEAHRDDPSRPNFEHAHLYMGEDPGGPGTALSGLLKAHVANELAKESAIEKEKRKAREARDARASDRKNKNASGSGAP